MAANRTQIIAGWCVQRMQHGEQWAWMIVVLAAMLGQIGLPGGGFGFGWHYNGAGTPGRKGVILSGFSGSTSIPPVHDNSDYKGYSSTIPIARFIDAILEPGKVINWNGKSVKLPPLKMCIFAGTNPFHRHQQINRIIEGWRKLETVIAIDNQWTSTCRFADIVLPATTQFERNDLDQYGNHSNRGIIAMKQVVPPQFEARNDFDIFRELCRRFNREEAFTEGLDEMGWLKRIWQEGVQQGKGRGVHLPAFDDFWNNKEYVEFDHPQMFVRHQAFREDPDFRLHSQLCESETLRQQYTVAGKEPVFINPQDASARGIRNGDVVRVFNARGQVLAGAVVSDRYAPGVARIHEGAWYDPDKGGEPGALCKYGNPNVLTIDIGTSQLAQLFSRELDDEQLTQIASAQMAEWFSLLKSEPPLTAAVNALENRIAALTVRDDARLELAADFCGLFLMTDKQAALPYASAYKQDEQEIKRLLVEAGMETSGNFNESADHLAIYLELLSHLHFSLGEGTVPARRIDSLRQKTLTALRQWLPEFAARCRQYDSFGFYAALSQLLLVLVECDHQNR